jgi:hypothetical protein
MSQVQQLIGDYLFVTLPASHLPYIRFKYDDNLNILFASKTKYGESYSIAALPPGQYSLIGVSDELSEEQWIEIIPYDNVMKCGWPYFKYEGEDTVATHSATAKISGNSLLKSKGLTRGLIIKQVK